MRNTDDEFNMAKESLAKDIIGEIVLSENSEQIIKKWRNIFKISQKSLANELKITSSVISDYESGRRKSPGIKMIKKYVQALLDIDIKRGGNVIKTFTKKSQPQFLSDFIIAMKEFHKGVRIDEFCKYINASILNKNVDINREIYGYTIIDSLKAVTEFSYQELIRLYGFTTQRALIFTKVSRGRTPMVAIKLTNLHPGLVIFHGLDIVDEVAKRIAEAENIPLAICRLEKIEDIKENLERIK